MPLLIVKMPANVIVVFKGFTDIINMNMIDKKMLYEKTIGRILPKKIETSDRLLLRILNGTEGADDASPIQTLGYVQSNILRDLLLAAVILGILAILIICMVLLYKYCYPKLPKSLKAALLSIKGKLMWSVILRYTTQTYLSVAIGAFLAVKTIGESSLVRKITILLQILYLALWPAMIFTILYRNRAVLAYP